MPDIVILGPLRTPAAVNADLDRLAAEMAQAQEEQVRLYARQTVLRERERYLLKERDLSPACICPTCTFHALAARGTQGWQHRVMRPLLGSWFPKRGDEQGELCAICETMERTAQKYERIGYRWPRDVDRIPVLDFRAWGRLYTDARVNALRDYLAGQPHTECQKP